MIDDCLRHRNHERNEEEEGYAHRHKSFENGTTGANRQITGMIGNDSKAFLVTSLYMTSLPANDLTISPAGVSNKLAAGT